MATARGKEIAGVGIGSPGPLDTKTGVVLLTPNLGWTNFPLRDRLAQALALPATLDNDANCAIFGEWRSEEHTSELQSRVELVCRPLLEKKKHTRFRSGGPRQDELRVGARH